MHGQSIEWPRLHRLAADGDVKGMRHQLASGAKPDVRREDGATALHIAAGRGQSDAVEVLLEYGASADAQTREHRTPLEFAVRYAPHVIEKLIQGGANPNRRGGEAQSLLRVAVEENKVEAIAPLVQGGADPYDDAVDGLTSLSLASKEGKTDAVVELISQTPGTVHHRDRESGSTALHHAASQGQVAVIHTLVAANADTTARNNAGRTPLHIAATADKPDAVAALLSHSANPNARDHRGWTPLHVATRDAGLDIVGQLLDSGAHASDPSTPGETPFHLAVLRADAPEVAIALLAAGADPNAEFGTEMATEHAIPLAAAAASGRCALVDAMLAGGAKANDDRGDNSPLEVAIMSADIDTVRALLAAGADPNGRYGDWPPLHRAAGMSPTMVEILLRYGAAPDFAFESQTALHIVTAEMPIGAARIVDLLLKHGASQTEPGGPDERPPLQQALAHEEPDLACINRLLSDAVEQMDDWPGGLDGLDDSWTPLHAAASNPNVPRGVILALVSFGCDCEAEGSEGTPLMLAAGAGSPTAIKELLNRGASANGEDDDMRPLTCAIEHGQVAAAASLVKAGAAVDGSEHIELALEQAFRASRPVSKRMRATPRKGSAAWNLTRSSPPTKHDVEMIRLLVSSSVEGGEVSALTGNLGERLAGATPLHWVAAFAGRSLVERCIRNQEHARLRDENGWSPLHWAACCNEEVKVLEWLLDKGAYPTARTRDSNQTPLQVAAVADNETSARCVRQHLASKMRAKHRPPRQRRATVRKSSRRRPRRSHPRLE